MVEKITFEFTFDSQWDSSPPIIELFNNNQQIHAPIRIEKLTTIAFDLDLEPGKINQFEILRSGHDNTNQLCMVTGLYTDGIDITSLLHHGNFYPDYPEPWITEQRQQGIVWPEYHPHWTSWGWNGVWKLSYQTPFYDWLIKII